MTNLSERKQENIFRIRKNFSYLSATCKTDIRLYLYQEYLLDDEINEKLDLPNSTESKNIEIILNGVIKKIKNQEESELIDYYKVFCAGLDSVNQSFIAERLNKTEIPEYLPKDESLEPEGTLRFKEAEKIDDLIKTLNKTSRDYKKLLDDLNQVKVNSEDQLKLMKNIDGTTKEYLIYTLNRDNGSPSKNEKVIDPAKTDPKTPAIQVTIETDRIAQYLAADCVNFMAGEPKVVSPHRIDMECAASLRECIAEIIKGNDDKLTGYITKLERTEVNGFETLCNVANYMFGFTSVTSYDGSGDRRHRNNSRKGKEMINWGRIVALYAFGGYLAMYGRVCHDRDVEKLISDYLGFYVSTKLGPWIDNKGGWEAMVLHFKKNYRKGKHNTVKEKAKEKAKDYSNLYQGMIIALSIIVGYLYFSK